MVQPPKNNMTTLRHTYDSGKASFLLLSQPLTKTPLPSIAMLRLSKRKLRLWTTYLKARIVSLC